ncbi:alpha-L-arabinofuranosidase C-terminal domain-containing protein [Chryseobacterium hagamense]|uniref:non-reducing end alpha-L-arabinofuranosidase n=1 Tax=Chryseobacterium hagamense TaxID=395935 RepID=A0A511YPW3_9FLAO|nr:alpha-L-arabinofuranosidase C-terminal domain-containing protein [Chryseobacterium hagamense]GEN77242.1 alpha-L-arabinofuranosidase [Chryseobacterium hagamense]
MNLFKRKLILLFSCFCIVSVLFSQSASGTVLQLDMNTTGIKIQPTMYGIFFEDINQAADGGLYAELVKNRSFEFTEPLTGWKQPNTRYQSENPDSGYATVFNNPNKTNHNYLRVTVGNDKNYQLVNEGFRGIGIQKEASYDFSCLLAKGEVNIRTVKAELVDENNKVVASAEVKITNPGWQKYSVAMKASRTVEKGKLRLTFTGKGTLLMDMVSLFPQDTWKGRKGGLRQDLVQKLYDLKPGFVRFPGGCIVEGRTLANRYQWKKTIGDVADRELIINRWNTEFSHRSSPDYFQTFGLGFMEYFQLAEDLGAAPLPILSCGMACQFNTGELVRMEDLDPYVQDALDLIEFANGDPAKTKWGKFRAELGHPQPFNLKFIGVGNEQWGPDYLERYRIFEHAIHSRYPEINIVSGSGPYSDGEYFDYGWKELKKLDPQLIDEHYYKPPQWFLENAARYDRYDRSGPKVFAGEYAAHSGSGDDGRKRNNWEAALSEAAFMTGLERNADVVYMSSYAPLFAHTDNWQWAPDLIWFNNLGSYATPSYYVQQLFSVNKGSPLTEKQRLYASAVKDALKKEVIVKIVNVDGTDREVEVVPSHPVAVKKLSETVLTASKPDDTNTFGREHIIPAEKEVLIKNRKIVASVPARSLVILKMKIR